MRSGEGFLRLSAILVLLTLLSLTEAHGSRLRRISNNGTKAVEDEAKEFLRRYNEDYAKLSNKYVIADWNYNTNLTDFNANLSLYWSAQLTLFSSDAFEQALQFNTTGFSDDTVRQLESVGSRSLSTEEMDLLALTISEMGNIYGTTTVCRDPPSTDCLYLEPGLTEVLASTNKDSWAEKLWAWQGWHDQVGKALRPKYITYTNLKNKLAQVNGFADYGEELRERYDDPNFSEAIKSLYDELFPLYKELHAYIRLKLSKHYEREITGTIPQHILGDMWGRFWSNLYSIAVPFPDKPSLDVTDNMLEQNYTIKTMFDLSNDFYQSMGLLPLPDTFFNLSMLEKPEDRDVVCHATAWDFYDAKDFRIKMCTNVLFDDLLTVHHEMGHIQYFMQYANQPTVYRDGANDGFHEAVGELMSMCVSTPKHLYAIGLLEDLLKDNETEINFLFSKAISTVSALPFHYLNDLWRWKIFASEPSIPESEWNNEFWKLSEELVGVSPPVDRSGADLLDGPTIFHVAQDYDMIRYFTRTILQFQFAESLCQVAGHEGPLHDCDFYGSLAAGNKLAAMLKLGASKPWPVALEALTGETTMNAKAIRKYFEPLEAWLKQENENNGNVPGWPVPDTKSKVKTTVPVQMKETVPATSTKMIPNVETTSHTKVDDGATIKKIVSTPAAAAPPPPSTAGHTTTTIKQTTHSPLPKIETPTITEHVVKTVAPTTTTTVKITEKATHATIKEPTNSPVPPPALASAAPSPAAVHTITSHHTLKTADHITTIKRTVRAADPTTTIKQTTSSPLSSSKADTTSTKTKTIQHTPSSSSSASSRGSTVPKTAHTTKTHQSISSHVTATKQKLSTVKIGATETKKVSKV